jgi:HMG-box domain
MKRGGYVTLTRDHLAAVVGNEQRTVEMIHTLTAQLANAIDVVVSSSFDRHSLAKTYQKVIVALATLQNSVQDLSKAYINHANTVLNPGRAGTLDLNLTTTLLDSGLLANRGPSPGTKQEAPTEVKKKRKRAAHDPNAPKRALTPYFLYMQSARPQIAQELGSNAKPKEVADEGTRRWGIMPEADKNVCRVSLIFVQHADFLPGLECCVSEESCHLSRQDSCLQGGEACPERRGRGEGRGDRRVDCYCSSGGGGSRRGSGGR